MEPIRVFVVDAQPMTRHGLAAMLRTEPGVAWIGDAADGAEALELAPPLEPDVVLIDPVLQPGDGIEALAAMRRKLPRAHFVVLTGQIEPALARRAMATGASGFLLKSASTQEVSSVIRSAARGQRVVAPEVSAALQATARGAGIGSDLTQRERELLAFMSRGLSNQEISSRMAIAMPTVKFHVTNILAKLNADNRTEAVLVALRNKLVELE